MALLGVCSGARGLSLVALRGLVIMAVPLVAERGSRAGASVVAMGRLRRAGSVVGDRVVIVSQQEESSQELDRTRVPAFGRGDF